jgi:hypothetical protein
MYIVITTHPDGDSYMVTADQAKAKAHFDSEVERSSDSVFSDSQCPIYLAEVKDGERFGFGGWGEIHGCEILEEHYPED